MTVESAPEPATGAALSADPHRISDLIAAFAALSAPGAGPGVTRPAYTRWERSAHELFASRMGDLGLITWTDTVGNTYAERPGTDPSLPALATGSHLDSVPNAGAYDGVAGVVAAMEVARLLVQADVPTRHPVRFVAFAAEEGSRFGQACTGSRVAAGLSDTENLRSRTDADGVTIADAMREVGLEPARADDARWRSDDWAVFVELHIEQGSLLGSLGVPIGVVDLISGSTRLLIEVTGRASHTGGTPMHLRADALAAASEIVLAAEELATDTRHHGTRVTVGRLDVEPGSITTIPGQCRLHVDVRDVDNDRQRETANELMEWARAIAERRGVGIAARVLADASPVILPGSVSERIAAACRGLGLGYRVMPSGASHDSQMVNHVLPAGMIFVPSLADGVSHAPEEYTSPRDLALGVDVLTAALLSSDTDLDRTGSHGDV